VRGGDQTDELSVDDAMVAMGSVQLRLKKAGRLELKSYIHS